MDYVRAVLCLGLFSFLSYAVIFDIIPANGGSSKTRALKGAMNSATEQVGVIPTGLGLFAIGLALAAFFVIRHRRYAEYE